MPVEPNAKPGAERALWTDVIPWEHDTAVGLLWAELDVARTRVWVAETTCTRETALRNLRNAWLALNAAQDCAERLNLDSIERRSFRDLHNALCLRLAELHIRGQDQARADPSGFLSQT